MITLENVTELPVVGFEGITLYGAAVIRSAPEIVVDVVLVEAVVVVVVAPGIVVVVVAPPEQQQRLLHVVPALEISVSPALHEPVLHAPLE